MSSKAFITLMREASHLISPHLPSSHPLLNFLLPSANQPQQKMLKHFNDTYVEGALDFSLAQTQQ